VFEKIQPSKILRESVRQMPMCKV